MYRPAARFLMPSLKNLAIESDSKHQEFETRLSRPSQKFFRTSDGNTFIQRMLSLKQLPKSPANLLVLQHLFPCTLIWTE